MIIATRLARRAAGVVAAALLAASFAPVQADPVRLRIGYDTIPLHIIPVIFAIPEFQRHNGKAYKVELFRFKGSPLQVQALAANEVDIAALAFSTFATAITTAKLPIKGIADLAQDGPWYSQQFAVKKDGPIKTVADLKGKTVATNAIGGATDMAARLMMVQNGLVPDKDVRFIEASFGAMGPMIRAAKIDVGAFPAPTWAVQSKQDDLRVLFRQSDALGNQQFLLYVAREDFIQKNRAALVAFYEDYLRGLKAALDPKNRARVLEVTARLGEAPIETFQDWAMLEGKDYFHAPDGKINVTALQSNIDTLFKQGLIKQTLQVAPHVDHSLVEEAAKRM